MADDDNSSQWVAICTRDRLNEKKIVCGKVADTGILVVQDGDVIYACERVCPHEQADLGLGYVVDGRIHCPRHQAWFDLDDGTISVGWTSRSLQLFPVRISDDQVWVNVS